MNDNKKLNIILGIVTIAAILISIYLGTIINNNENARIYFHMEDIENINWISSTEDITFKIENNYLTFIIGEDTIIDNKKIDLNTQDGSITYDGISDKLYLRSVSSENLVIWYEKTEYHLSKEIINK